jgi:hypothetical protein
MDVAQGYRAASRSFLNPFGMTSGDGAHRGRGQAQADNRFDKIRVSQIRYMVESGPPLPKSGKTPAERQ